MKLNENLKEKTIAYEQLRKEKCERHGEEYQDPEEVKLELLNQPDAELEQ